MAEAPSVQEHLLLSRAYLESAERSFQAGLHAPAHFLMMHAPELAVKAALAAALGSVPKTHNVGGLFGKHFRERAGAGTTRRINRILGDYDGPRYPDYDAPTHEELEEDMRFVGSLVRETIPRLIQERLP